MWGSVVSAVAVTPVDSAASVCSCLSICSTLSVSTILSVRAIWWCCSHKCGITAAAYTATFQRYHKQLESKVSWWLYNICMCSSLQWQCTILLAVLMLSYTVHHCCCYCYLLWCAAIALTVLLMLLLPLLQHSAIIALLTALHHRRALLQCRCYHCCCRCVTVTSNSCRIRNCHHTAAANAASTAYQLYVHCCCIGCCR